MSVPDNEISPPETEDYVNCGSCRALTFVDDLTDGVCAECRPCSECGGSGCDECIEEVPKLPRAGIEIAMDKAAESVMKLHPNHTKHLIRQSIAAHMDPEIQKLKDVIVGLIVVSTNAVAQYAIATKDSLGQDEISELKNTIAGMAASQTFLIAKFLSGLELEVEQKELRESNVQLMEAAKASLQLWKDRGSGHRTFEEDAVMEKLRIAIEAAKDAG